MHQVELFVCLLAVVGFVGAISQKIRVALPILLVVVGMIISVIPTIPDVLLEPDAVFFIFLPPLLYVEAFNTSWKKLQGVGEEISFQAVGLVLVTVAAVAAVIHAVVPAMPWSAAFVLGAIVSPTDAVAATSIAKEVHLPTRLMDIIKGESLVNDATGLVAYQFAVAATVTGAFSWEAAGERFLYVSIGGVLIGLAMGYLLAFIRTKLDHRPVEIVVSLLSPFIAYLTAEHLHVSSVLSVVTAGLYLGWRGPTMLSSHVRLQSFANWETIVYVLNGFSFLLMGLQLDPIMRTVKTYPPLLLVFWTLAAAFAPLAIRFLWIFSLAPLYCLIKKRPMPSWQLLFVLSWSGMRGVVSLAAALALPMVCANGAAFPYRDLLTFLTIAIILSTILFQGATLPLIVNKFGFSPNLPESELIERQARVYLAREALRRIDEVAREKQMDMDDPTVRRILNRYLERAMSNVNPDVVEPLKSETWILLLDESIKMQRQVLVAMRSEEKIDDELFRILQNELDLEEAQMPSSRNESLL